MTGKTYIVHGPSGCGKTRFARLIARVLGCTTTVDSWDPDEGHQLLAGALHLTSTPIVGPVDGATVLAFHDLDFIETVPAAPVPPRCDSCRFWSPTNIVGHGDYILGQCHKRSPKSIEKKDGKILTVWPIVKDLDQCGEFRPRPQFRAAEQGEAA